MNFRKHWKKLCLSGAALFWASCSTSEDSEPVGPISGENLCNDSSELSTNCAGGMIALYGVAPIYDPDSGYISSSDTCEEDCESSLSSSSSDSIEQSSSSKTNETYGYKVFADTTINCKKGSFEEDQQFFNATAGMTLHKYVTVKGFICNNDSNYSAEVLKQKGDYLYTPEEYEKLFGICAEHGGRKSTQLVIPNQIVSDHKINYIEGDLKMEYYFQMSANNWDSQEFSEEKKACFKKFYEDIEPVCAYGTFTPQSSSSTMPKSIEKITCMDGTVFGEEEYNTAVAHNDSLNASYEQQYNDKLYCTDLKYKARLDECNNIDDSGKNIPAPAPDTVSVSKELLDDPSKCN